MISNNSENCTENKQFFPVFLSIKYGKNPFIYILTFDQPFEHLFKNLTYSTVLIELGDYSNPNDYNYSIIRDHGSNEFRIQFLFNVTIKTNHLMNITINLPNDILNTETFSLINNKLLLIPMQEYILVKFSQEEAATINNISIVETATSLPTTIANFLMAANSQIEFSTAAATSFYSSVKFLKINYPINMVTSFESQTERNWIEGLFSE
jgi:hypothetical protein